eukprot:179718_1
MGKVLTIPRVKPSYLRIIGLTSAITTCKFVFGAICLSDNYGNTLWWKAGRSASINSIGDTVTFDGIHWATAYGSQLINRGIHQWRLKIYGPHLPNLWIGLSSSVDLRDGFDFNKSKDDGTTFYSYTKLGGLYDSKNWGGNPQLSKFGPGDIVTMKVDFESDAISFAINNSSFQTAWSSIDSDGYRLAAYCADEGTKIKILSYVNNLTETEPKSNRITWHRIMLVGAVLVLCGGYIYIKMQRQTQKTNIQQNGEEEDQKENEDMDEKKEQNEDNPFILHDEDEQHNVVEQCQISDDFKEEISRPEERKD